MEYQRLEIKRLTTNKTGSRKARTLTRHEVLEMHAQITEIDGSDEPFDF